MSDISHICMVACAGAPSARSRGRAALDSRVDLLGRRETSSLGWWPLARCAGAAVLTLLLIGGSYAGTSTTGDGSASRQPSAAREVADL